MKIKLFVKSQPSQLEAEVNEFLSDNENDVYKIIDMKYSSSESYCEILLIYEEL